MTASALPRGNRPQSALASVVVVVIALVWLTAFAWCFFSQTLPNNSVFTRAFVLDKTADLLLENIHPSQTIPGKLSGWRYFPQRFDLLVVAGSILAAAWGLGHLILRLLRLERRLPPAARSAFAFGLGLSGWSLITLGLGLCGLLERWMFVLPMGAAFCAEAGMRLWSRRRSPENASTQDAGERVPLLGRRFFRGSRIPALVLLAVAPFLLAMLLGAMLPPTVDFDEKEYHLQGPKEWYLQGEVTFLPHNVYTSFPFLTEMLTLLAMVLRGDWHRGALAGRTVLMAFAPLTALALYAAGRFAGSFAESDVQNEEPPVRIGSGGSTAGWLAVLVFLTTPWVYRISVIAYAEGGLAFYLFAALLAMMILARDLRRNDAQSRSLLLLTGLLAGSAMACKYPGVLSVVIPLGAAAVWFAIRRGGHELAGGVLRRGVSAGGLFAVGAGASFGPWALKNIVQTGNPVYPLLYSVFGGRDWDDALNAKWTAGHSPPRHLLEEPSRIVPDITAQMLDLTLKSDWQSALVFGGAALSVLLLLRGGRSPSRTIGARGVVLGAMLYVVWLFVTWWAFTHRIDRFWVPMLPVVCLLSGMGLAAVFAHIDRLSNRYGLLVGGPTRALFGVMIAFVTTYNLAFVTSPLSANNDFLRERDQARRSTITHSISIVNSRVPPDARVLLVGEAEVFDANFEPIYNTVFDRSIFEEICSAGSDGSPSDSTDVDAEMRPAEEIRSRLREAGITHVFVNWLEILRYREPGSYGYTDFVSPDRFMELVDAGVLAPQRLTASESTAFVDQLSEGKQQVLEHWGPELRTVVMGRPAISAYQLFAVVEDE